MARAKLKRLVADTMLDVVVLKDLLWSEAPLTLVRVSGPNADDISSAAGRGTQGAAGWSL